MATILGTAKAVSMGGSASPGALSLSADVPVGATLAILLARGASGDTNSLTALTTSFGTVTLLGSAMPVGSGGSACALAYVDVGGVGSGHTITPTFESGIQPPYDIGVVFLDDVATDWLRDWGIDRNNGWASVTIDTAVDDLVLVGYGYWETTPGSVAGTTTLISPLTTGNNRHRVATLDAPADGTATLTANEGGYSTVVAISIISGGAVSDASMSETMTTAEASLAQFSPLAAVIESVALTDSALGQPSSVCVSVEMMDAVSQQSAESILLVDQQESIESLDNISAISSNVAATLESVAPMDSAAAQSTLLVLQAEVLELASVLVAVFAAQAAIAEPVSAADQVVAQSTLVVFQTEVVSPADVLIGLLSGQIVIVESVAATDSLIGLPVNVKALTESISAADLVSGQSTVLVALSESVNLADVSAALLGGDVGIVESVALLESRAVTLASVASVSEQLLPSDVLRVIEDVDAIIVETINPLDISTTARTLVWLIPPSDRVARLLPINRIASVVI